MLTHNVCISCPTSKFSKEKILNRDDESKRKDSTGPSCPTPKKLTKMVPKQLSFGGELKRLAPKRLWENTTEKSFSHEDKENFEPGVWPLCEPVNFEGWSSENSSGSTTDTASESEIYDELDTEKGEVGKEDDLADLTIEKLLEDDLPIDELLALYDVTDFDTSLF
ncbi:uncharacterized protein LOC116182712 [Photinus pyralis]|uniref:uncharacterized protein LOC116182712 n=1 Tax=Photinus pyralis TaxID=7054 RepID=UPI00126718C1|nr:uncharacterized protein LOC116182712 [Photinus pyralis]